MHNGPGNCVLFTASNLVSDISCFALINNTCASHSGYPGLLFLRPAVVMTSCVFQANHFDYFLGTDEQINNVTFVRCIFDNAPNITKNISFTLSGCTSVIDLTVLPQCITMTPPKTRTATLTENVPNKTFTVVPIIWIAVACLFAVVASAIAGFICWRRAHRYVLTPLHSHMDIYEGASDSTGLERQDLMVRWRDRERF
jgi:hypothetical protein